MDLSSLYQFISSSYVLVPCLGMGTKITSFILTFYWSFLFKYRALVQGPIPSAPMSAAGHGGTSLQSPAPAVPSSAPALPACSSPACPSSPTASGTAGGMGSFLSQSKPKTEELVSCSKFQVVSAKLSKVFCSPLATKQSLWARSAP